jgi:signal transduction histidine kinase
MTPMDPTPAPSPSPIPVTPATDLPASSGELDAAGLRARVALLEDELASTRDKLRYMEEIDRIHADFAFAISHELRTPLTLISGYAQKLLMRWSLTDDERRRGMVEKINVSSHRLTRLIEDMLLVTDVERGELPMHIKSVAVPTVVDQALTDVRDRYQERLPAIAVSGEPLHALADGFRLEQALICLLDNAVKHAPTDSTVTVAWHEADGRVGIAVSDEGKGIEAADLPRLFTRFGRLERVLGQSHGGIGLGLYIARRLVEAMGGAITVDSTPGEGSTFHVTLPSN